MTQHTTRDMIWDAALRLRDELKAEERLIDREFDAGDVLERIDADVSKRHVRDTLSTMAAMGWLFKYEHGGTYPASYKHPDA